MAWNFAIASLTHLLPRAVAAPDRTGDEEEDGGVRVWLSLSSSPILVGLEDKGSEETGRPGSHYYRKTYVRRLGMGLGGG